MIHLVVALEAEARPLIEHYALGTVEERPFRMREGEGMRLIVSGIGKAACAAATAYLRASAGDGPAAWLNVGVGGQRELEVGTSILAHKVTDGGSGRSWYPPFAFRAPCKTAEVLTVERPEETYDSEVVYDMEASGFMAAASRFATAELVHVWKVVSDNRESPPPTVTRKRVGDLVAAHLGEIEAVVARLDALVCEVEIRENEPAELRSILARWRFTVTEERRLRRLLARFETLAPRERVRDEELDRLPGAAAVLSLLEERLRSLPVRLDRGLFAGE